MKAILRIGARSYRYGSMLIPPQIVVVDESAKVPSPAYWSDGDNA